MATKKAEIAVREKSGGYPYHILATALKLGEAVKQHGGRNVPRAVLASELEMAEAGFGQLCASAKMFGIVEGTRDLSLTNEGHDYFFPIDDTSKRTAELEFLVAPPTFRSLIEQFDGKRIPSAALLTNVMQRQFRVPQSWAARAASIFNSTVTSLGVVDSAGFLRYGAHRHSAGQPRKEMQPPRTYSGEDKLDADSGVDAVVMQDGLPTHVIQAKSKVDDDGRSNVWTYCEAGGAVRLETSDPLPKALWERLKRYVDVLEPTELKQGDVQ
jgi:hypothetical protein